MDRENKVKNTEKRKPFKQNGKEMKPN